MNMIDFVGKSFGKYRIEAPLSAGGMGQVFRGVDTYLGRPAAIKLMHASLAANPQFRDRFLQEARSAAALAHPNIVTIYAFDEQDGQFYLAMELMTGGSLRALLDQRRTGQPMSLATGLELVRQAAEGLAAAHQQRVIHRDIKPDNLLLNRTREQGSGRELLQLKITDFGLARLAQGSGLTTAGVPMGTLAYMSPEQCIGKDLDGRSDLYSLGIVLYEVATGSQPFQISNYGEALEKHVKTPPPPPRSIRPDLTPALEEVILRSLAKKPEDRYQTGTEFAAALQRVGGMADMRAVGSIPFTIPGPVPPVQRTTLNVPDATSVASPRIQSLPGIVSSPRVRVIDRGSNTLQIVELTPRGLLVGRKEADVVLPSSEVSRQHAQIYWEGSRVMVKDLGSGNGTLLNDVRLPAQVGQPWANRQLLRVGPYWLRLEGADAAASIPTSPSMVNPTYIRNTVAGQGPIPLTADFTQRYSQRTPVYNSIPGTSGEERIGVLMEQKTLTITPGQPTSFKVTLANMGTIVDWLTVIVEGVPPAWVSGPATEVQLNPGTQDTVELRVNVERVPGNLAQEYPVTIRARSRENPNEFGITRAHWTVLPFREDSMRMEPRRVVGRGSANYAVILRNGGNTPVRYELSGEDDEQKMDYRFKQPVVDLNAGNEIRIPLQVVSNRRLLGREQRQPFQIHAHVVGNTLPLSSQGEFVNNALLPTWVVPVALVALSLAGVALGFASGLIHNPLTSATPTPTVAVAPTPTVAVTPTPKATTASNTLTPTVGGPSPTPVPAGAGTTVNWTTQNSGSTSALLGIASGFPSSGHQYVIVGSGGTILTSTDGSNWTPVTDPNTNDLNAVIWAKTHYVAVGKMGTILTSPDGNTWTAATTVPTTNELTGVVWSESLYVAVGKMDTILTSPDGDTWTAATTVPATANDLASVVWSRPDIGFVAVGGVTGGATGSATILTSKDGLTWTQQTSTTTSFLRSIAWSGTQFMAVGNSGAVLVSPDGVSWTNKPIDSVTKNLGVVFWTETQFVIGGDGGTLLTSKDGSAWTQQTSNTSHYIRALTKSNSQYIAVGHNGTIVTGQ